MRAIITKYCKYLVSNIYVFLLLLFPAYLLGAKKDCNIILVNIKDPLSKDYPQLVWHSAAIGGCVKSLILLLIKHCGLNVSDLHIIGHSMGAQIGGLAGDGLAADGFLIHRLTGTRV